MEGVGIVMDDKYFTLESTPYYETKYLIKFDYKLCPFPHGTHGSYNVIAARLLNLSYAEYLRFCRDVLGADLIGRNHLYVLPYFDATPDVRRFVKMLNQRMKYVMHEQEFPYEYQEDQSGVIKRTPFVQDETNT
jgi:hypothetical protein